MFYAYTFTQYGAIEIRYIARCIDVGIARAQLLVHDDAIVNRKSSLSGQFGIGQDTQSGDNPVGGDFRAIACGHNRLATIGPHGFDGF